MRAVIEVRWRVIVVTKGDVSIELTMQDVDDLMKAIFETNQRRLTKGDAADASSPEEEDLPDQV